MDVNGEPEVKEEKPAGPLVALGGDSVEQCLNGEGEGGSDGRARKKRRVVREMDVFVAPRISPHHKMFLLQYPLRPSWRPYGLERRLTQIRVKPEQARVEVDLTIDTNEGEYDPDAPEELRIKTQTLTSLHLDLPTIYAVGVLEGDKLHLSPIDAVMQLRPSLLYLDDTEASKKAGAPGANPGRLHWRERQQGATGEEGTEKAPEKPNKKGPYDIDDEEGDDTLADELDQGAAREPAEEKPTPVQVQVMVKAKETEEQEEMRLQSYAHIQAELEKEPWVHLEPFGPESVEALQVMQHMTSTRLLEGPEAAHGAQGSAEPLEGALERARDEYLSELVKETEKQHGPGPSGAPTPGVKRGPMGQAMTGVQPWQLSGPSGPLGAAGLSRSYLNTLPLAQRLHALLSMATTHIWRFERLLKVAPEGAAEDEVLRVLQLNAMLVQGCWVAASGLRYGKGNPTCVVRDYVLLRFTRDRVIPKEDLEHLCVPKELLREVLLAVAVQRGPHIGWEFKEPCDKTFLRLHSDVARSQADKWQKVEHGISAAAAALNLPTMADVEREIARARSEVAAKAAGRGRGRGAGFGAARFGAAGIPGPPGAAGVPGARPGVPAAGPRFGAAATSGASAAAPAAGAAPGSSAAPAVAPGAPRSVAGPSRPSSDARAQAQAAFGVPRGSVGPTTVPLTEENRLALAATLPGLFAKHHVLTLPFLCQCLREHAQSVAASEGRNSQAVTTAVAAARAAASSPSELAGQVAKVATNIGRVHFLHSLGDPSLDPFRDVVVELLRSKGPMGGIKKTEVAEAIKRKLNTEASPAVFQKVLKELCYPAKGGLWMLRTGDGRPL